MKMMIQLTKKEQDNLGVDIINLKRYLDKLLENYNFEYDGNGQDLTNGYFEFFYFQKSVEED